MVASHYVCVMYPQIIRIFEDFITYITLKGMFSTMYALMLDQIIPTYENTITDVTRK
jgi:hypothetical protein